MEILIKLSTWSNHLALKIQNSFFFKKAMYGLKQQPQTWFDKFSNYLLEYGFICSKVDPSLFVYQKDSNAILLLMYVDDMVVTGKNSRLLQAFITDLSIAFKMKDMGQMYYFMGIQ